MYVQSTCEQNKVHGKMRCISCSKNKYSCVTEQCISPGTIFHYKNFLHYLKSCFPLQHELEKKKIPTHTQPKHISSCLCFVTKYYIHEPSSFRIIQLTTLVKRPENTPLVNFKVRFPQTAANVPSLKKFSK